MNTDLTPPILFDVDHPLVIRLLRPHGFVLETYEGQTICHFGGSFDDMRIHLAPVPTQDKVALTIEMEWTEL